MLLIFIEYYDVKVKRYPMALSLVKLHKQPKGLAQLRRRCCVPGTWPLIFSGLSTAASEGRARACPRRLCNLTRRCSLSHLLTSTSYYISPGSIVKDWTEWIRDDLLRNVLLLYFVNCVHPGFLFFSWFSLCCRQFCDIFYDCPEYILVSAIDWED